MGENIKMIAVNSVGGAASEDGEHGLFKFGRVKPSATGETEFWIGVPKDMLPFMAALSLKMLPQPEKGLNVTLPAVLQAQKVSVGKGPQGQIAVSMTIEQGAVISFEIDELQAQSIATALENILGNKFPPGKPSGLN